MDRKSLLAPALMVAALCAATAPARADVVEGVGTYIQDRINDFADIFRIRAGIPNNARSAGIKARATMFAQIGYVHFDGDYWGMDRRSIGKVEELRTEGGVSVFYGSNTEMVPILGNTFLKGDSAWSEAQERTLVRYLAAWDDGRKRPFSFGLELATPVIAFDLGLYPTEAFDFLIGFTTIDLYKDDRLFLPSVPPEAPAIVPPRPDEDAVYRDLRLRFAELKEHFERMDVEAEMAEVEQRMGYRGEPRVDLDRERLVPTLGTEGGITRDAADELDRELELLEKELERLQQQIEQEDGATDSVGEPPLRSPQTDAVERAVQRQEEAVRRQAERRERELAEEEARTREDATEEAITE